MCPPAKITEFHDFEKVHAILLAASGIPPALHRQLFRKLSTETFDGGDYFTIEQCDGGLQRRLHLSAQLLRKESDLFLIDHAWTFRLAAALKQLKEVPGLAERMAALMCVDLDVKYDSAGVIEVESEENQDGLGKNVSEILEKEMERVGHSATWLDFEELGIDDYMLSSLDLSTRFPVSYFPAEFQPSLVLAAIEARSLLSSLFYMLFVEGFLHRKSPTEIVEPYRAAENSRALLKRPFALCIPRHCPL